MRLSLFGSLVLVTFSGATLCAQNNARDAFWSASDLVSVSANPGAKPSSHPAVVRKQTPAAASHGAPHVDPVLVAQNGYGEAPHMVHVSNDQIGVRYSVMLRDANGKYNDVSPTEVFHSGDYLHLTVMANQPGYLYVVQQGSSGKWSPIFPARGSAPEANKVEQGKVTEIPTGASAFQFDSTPGEEQLYIIVSRNPIEDLDGLISGLKKPGGATNTQAPVKAPDMSVYEAQNKVPAELERFASRDLNLVQVEDVDAKKPAAANEHAVYVVSKGSATSTGPRVVASLTLKHQ
jgi:hypothetical protein